LSLVLIAVGYCLIEMQGAGDLLIYLNAAGDLPEHEDIYSKVYIDGYHYYYSVLFAIILQPFVYLPYSGVKFFWLLLNLGLFIHLFTILSRSTFTANLNPAQKNLFLLLVFVFSLRFLHDNLHAAQITIIILWCSIYGILQVIKGNNFSGGMLIAIGINLKLLPVVLLPYLLYRGYFKAFGWIIIVYIFMLLIPSVIIGNEYNFFLLNSWLNLINPTNKQHIMDVDERSFHSMTTLLTTLFIENPPDPLALDLKRNIADVPLRVLAFIILSVRLILAGLTLYFLRLRTIFKTVDKMSSALEVSYILLVIPLIFPHQQHYAFLFAAPAFGVIVYFLILNRQYYPPTKFRMIVIFLSVIYLCCNLKILLGAFNRYYEHYKILTYGALLIIPLLMMIRADLNKFRDYAKE
jgi:hypothetical protein